LQEYAKEHFINSVKVSQKVTSRYGRGHELVGRKNQNIHSSLPVFCQHMIILCTKKLKGDKVKLLYNQGSCSLPENWSKSPDTWPDLTFGDIYLYSISSTRHLCLPVSQWKCI